MEEGSNGMGEVTASAILYTQIVRGMHVGDKKVPNRCDFNSPH